MEQEGLISIILPTHNGERFIEQSIESVMVQSFNRWELVIVNDGSTDNTLDIIGYYREKDERIKVINNKENMGLPRSLNLGFEHSHGSFLTWCSDDNYYLPDALKKMYNYLSINDDKPMVCAACSVIENDGKEQRRIQYDAQREYISNSVGACFLYRRSVMQKIGGYDENKFLVEDYDYWLRILEFCGEIGYIEEPLLVYRNQSESLTSTRFAEIQERRIQLLWEKRKWILDRVKEDKIVSALFYLDLYEHGYLDNAVDKECFNRFPPLKGIRKPDPKKEYIIFGAGKNGKMALETMKAHVKYFADSDERRCGTIYEGVPVITLKELVTLKNDYNIMISTGKGAALAIMEVLYRNKVEEYSLFNPAQIE